MFKSRLNQGFQGSQPPRAEVVTDALADNLCEKSSQSSDNQSEDNSPTSVNSVCDTFETGTISIKIEQNTVQKAPPLTIRVDYSTYPHLTSSMEAAKVNRANFCKKAMLRVTNKEEFVDWRSHNCVSQYEIAWVYENLLTPGQQHKFDTAKKIVTSNLIDMIDEIEIESMGNKPAEPISTEPVESLDVEALESLDEIHITEVVALINKEKQRLNLSEEEVVAAMLNAFGTSDLDILSDKQIWQWFQYLESMPDF